MLLKAGKNNLTPNGKRKMQENTDKIKAEYKELKKSKTAVIKSLVSRAHKIYDTKGIDKEGMISDILVAKYGSAKVKAAFNESVDIDEAYIRAVDFQKAAKEVGKLKSGLDQNAINQISKLLNSMFKNSSLKIRDNAVLAINKLKSKVQRDTRVSIDKILTANNLLKGGNITVESTDMQEALNVQQRMKLKQSMRRNKAKIAMGRKRAARKLASPEKLQKRAEKAARTAMVKKILKDKDKSDLSYAARKGIEDRLAKKKGQIKTMAKKLLKTVRLKDRAKLQKKPGA
jgi:hypothetical protein|tara:strand:+ start:14259 stop:15119 length:861 start_codon:yes stop_codon:yes gene_type:complete